MENFLKRGGPARATLRRVRGLRPLADPLGLLRWTLFRLRHRNFHYQPPQAMPAAAVQAALAHKERSLRTLVTQRPHTRFLEVGIGAHPHVERVQLMMEHNIRYTACDFATVCQTHERVLRQHGVPTAPIRFACNQVGTYGWTLFELLEEGIQFDVIYLDGHHTFYVDLPAFFLLDQLLVPGGLFLLDDIEWSLHFLQNTLLTSYKNWRFYHRMYDFSLYTEAQQREPHMQRIAETLLLGRLGYAKDEVHSTPQWWALHKPAGEGRKLGRN